MTMRSHEGAAGETDEPGVRRLEDGAFPIRPSGEDTGEAPADGVTIFPEDWDTTGATVTGGPAGDLDAPADPVAGSVIAEDWGRLPGNDLSIRDETKED